MINIEKPGAPCWLDIGSPDTAASSNFYGAVLGWEFMSAGPDAGGYGIWKTGGETVAGVGPLTDEGAKSGWIVYYNVPDIQEATETVRSSGGTVRVEPMDMMGQGHMAQYTDPTGGQFAVWQAAPGAATDDDIRVDAPGALTWVELYTTDGATAQSFYQRLFGWQITDMPLPGDGPERYHILTVAGGNPEKDGHGGMMVMSAGDLPGGHAYWSPVFETTDCDRDAAQVTAAGGTLQMGPADMEGVGKVATCLDPFGASFSLITSVG
ncbi:VOC family protein [Streptomyces lonarensis]|uniref:VOC family protein n=1 Tax=Streptomyces lonarensis TaxID=700599 RepID=A0A7X6HZ18_9ACTN|nr:VOC family protein [Streptomyces lonarensis]NJQ06176.1 VOC family protein [Streptomyces lonarensis]